MQTPKNLLNAFLIKTFGYKLVIADPSEHQRRTQIQHALERYADRVKGDALDVGAGTWTWPREYFSKQAHYVAFDQFQCGDTDIVGDMRTLSASVGENAWDVILCMETFEHLADPFAGISEIEKSLKPGGFLIASAPFVHELHGEDYGDYWRITRQGWEVLLKNFKNVEIQAFGKYPKPYHYVVSATKAL